MKILIDKDDTPIFVRDKLSTNYCIYLSKEEMLAILDHDKQQDGESLFDMLEAMAGVSEIEYTGLLGPRVFLTIDLEDDNRRTWRKIGDVLRSICYYKAQVVESGIHNRLKSDRESMRVRISPWAKGEIEDNMRAERNKGFKKHISKGLVEAAKEAQKRIEQEQQRKEEGLSKYRPACTDSTRKNLKDGYYCWFCDKAWYNCLCCHEED